MAPRPEPIIPGDIVLCRYPHVENPARPGLKIRPALIVDAGETYGLATNTLIAAEITTRGRGAEERFYDAYIPLAGHVQNEHLMPHGTAENSSLIATRVVALAANHPQFFPSGMMERGRVEEVVLTLARQRISRREAPIDLRPLNITFHIVPDELLDGARAPLFTFKTTDGSANTPQQPDRPRLKRRGNYLRRGR